MLKTDSHLPSLAAWLGPEAAGHELPVGDVHLDSRRVRPGDVFVALEGGQLDGRGFAPAAVAAGAVAVLVEAGRAPADFGALGVPVIQVAGLRGRLAGLAASLYGLDSLPLRLLGVTGTNGKTTVACLLAQLLSALGERCGMIGTLGWGWFGTLCEPGLTTPDELSLARILRQIADDGGRYVAMEVSSHGLAQGRVAQLRFDAAVFTNLSRDHLDYHGSMEDYADAKRSLFSADLPLAVFNVDDPTGDAWYRAEGLGQRRISYSLSDARADVYCRQLCYDAGGSRATLVSPWGEGELRCPLLGDFNLLNAIACVALLGGLGLELEQVLAQLPGVAGPPGRTEVAYGDGPLVIVDYAHTPDALERVLAAVRRHVAGRVWLVFGCGGDRDRGKRPLMGRAAEGGADRVVLTSDNPRSENPEAILQDILQGIGDPGQVLVDADRESAIHRTLALAAADDLVLIAGKGHEDYQEVRGERRPFSDGDCVADYFRSGGEVSM